MPKKFNVGRSNLNAEPSEVALQNHSVGHLEQKKILPLLIVWTGPWGAGTRRQPWPPSSMSTDIGSARPRMSRHNVESRTVSLLVVIPKKVLMCLASVGNGDLRAILPWKGGVLGTSIKGGYCRDKI